MKKNWLRVFFINILTVTAILVIVELVCRVVLSKIYNRKFDHQLVVKKKYGPRTDGMKPLYTTTVWGKSFSTDSLGWRKVKTNNRGKKKWLFIGDSVAEGVGVGDSSTFASICSEKFDEYNIENCSLIGYSTYDYLHVLDSLVQNDSSIELVTIFYCLNDVYGPHHTDDLPVMAQRTILGKLNGLLQDRYATYKLIKLWFYKNSNRYFTYDLGFYSAEELTFKSSMNYIKHCRDICRSREIYFNVVMLPYRSQLKDKNFVPQQLVKSFCEKDSIDFSDASEYLLKQPDYNSLYLFADEIHFSEKGHRAIAEFLSE
jgi:lysophospholipase L1-like esterase